MDQRLKKIIQNIEEIPTLPIVSQKILEIMSREDASYQDIVKVVETDQSLALKILKIANSAFYGSLTKIDSLEHAMIKLGMNEVKSIVLGVSVHNFFSKKDNTVFDRERFWQHAIICSQVAKYLAGHYRIGNDDSLFLSGLIHDMGKVVIDQYFHDDFVDIIEYLDSNHTTFSEAEKAILGTTHYQIAAKLLNQWRFPRKVIIYVLYHHAPWADEGLEKGSVILYLANIITKLAGNACYPNEKEIDPNEFIGSSKMDFIRKMGYDLDDDILTKFENHVREFIVEESDNVMSLFD